MNDVGALFGGWPPPALALPVGRQPESTAEWFAEWDVFRRLLPKLVAMGIAESDPDVQLWWGVVNDDTKIVEDAFRRGADPNVRTGVIVGRYRNFI